MASWKTVKAALSFPNRSYCGAPRALALVTAGALAACNADISVTEADNEPPSLSAIALGGPFFVSDTITIEATADDPDPDQTWDTVTVITDIEEAVQLGDPTEVPGGGLWTFEYPASVLADSVSVTATDSQGATTTVAVAIDYVDNTPPSVTFVTPETDQRFALGTTVIVEVNVSDTDQTEQSLDLAWSGLPDLSTAPANPDSTGYASFNATNLPEGTYTVGLTVTDAAGDTATRNRTFHVVDPDADNDGDELVEFGGTDCDDDDPAVNGNALEICDDKDNDCNSLVDDDATDATTWYTDFDIDGYGDPATATVACDQPPSTVDRGGDCDDDDNTAYPGNPEVCDGVDNDCANGIDDGLTRSTFYPDSDGDDYGVTSGAIQACVAPGADWSTVGGDCNDGDGAVNPGATEVCNGIDDDCVGGIDNGLTYTTYYTDNDEDTYGVAGTNQSLCADPGAGYATRTGDCNDSQNSINPDATEICDGIDNDCAGGIDDGLAFTTYYEDGDGDGYGVTATAESLCSDPGPGFATVGGDCNDTTGAVRPGATEVCNGIDDDCANGIDDGLALQTFYPDLDGDNYGVTSGATQACVAPGADWSTVGGDCNDSDISVNPGAPEVCNGIDDNCIGGADDGLTFTTWYTDADTDGYGVTSTAQDRCNNPGPGYSTSPGDCNDSNNAINPGEAEVCNGIDDDCVGGVDNGLAFTTYYTDNDEDTYGVAGTAQSLCADPGAGYATRTGDCNDGQNSINPDATEICDGIDNDCAGGIDDGLAFTTYYDDGDGDGYGVTATAESLCSDPGAGFATVGGDCDDSTGAVRPGATEVCNGIDDDCANGIDDGLTLQTFYPDLDGDNYGVTSGATQACVAPGADWATVGGDCNDSESAVNPGASEVCNGIDDDCVGGADTGLTFTTYYTDNDQDTYGVAGTGQSLCADPGAGFATRIGDCNDGLDTINPDATEVCDGVDNDCAGGIDDGLTFATYYPDGDGDGYGVTLSSESLCADPGVGWADFGGDCNDNNANIHPNLVDNCDGVDTDCDTLTDENQPATTWYLDSDGDLYGTTSNTREACTQPNRYVDTPGDCNDGDDTIFPNQTDDCNGVNNDCDASTDEDEPPQTYWDDNDNDGYGDPNDSVTQCTQPVGHTTNDGDCDDNVTSVNPGATEVCDGVDNNCAGGIDDGLSFTTYYTDGDEDTYGVAGTGQSLCADPGAGYATRTGDCDDGANAVNPGATEVCNGIDDDCVGGIDDGLTFTTYYTDNDEDTYGVAGTGQSLCAAPGAGFANRTGDCNDAASAVNPDATEVCDGIDNDCAGGIDDGLTFTTYYVDGDGDGYGVTATASSECIDPGTGYSTVGGDCLDGDDTVFPTALDDCNGVNNDCDAQTDEDDPPQTWYRDSDNDNFGDLDVTTTACTQPAGYVADDTDCDDGAAAVYPGAAEVCNGVDDDCANGIDDGLATSNYYEDVDGDGYGGAGPLAQCGPFGDWDALVGGDCLDSNALVNPDGIEVCDDGLDNDCVGGDEVCPSGPDYSGWWQVRETSDDSSIDFSCDGGVVSFDFERLWVVHSDPDITLYAWTPTDLYQIRVNGCEPGISCSGTPPGMVGAFDTASTTDWSAGSRIDPLLGLGYSEIFQWRATGGAAGSYATFTSDTDFEGSFHISFADGAFGSVPPSCKTTVIDVYGWKE